MSLLVAFWSLLVASSRFLSFWSLLVAFGRFWSLLVSFGRFLVASSRFLVASSRFLVASRRFWVASGHLLGWMSLLHKKGGPDRGALSKGSGDRRSSSGDKG